MSLDPVGRLNEPRSGRMVKWAHWARAQQGPNESLRMGPNESPIAHLVIFNQNMSFLAKNALSKF